MVNREVRVVTFVWIELTLAILGLFRTCTTTWLEYALMAASTLMIVGKSALVLSFALMHSAAMKSDSEMSLLCLTMFILGSYSA